jgi:methionine-rich copper-binding protein CopC
MAAALNSRFRYVMSSRRGRSSARRSLIHRPLVLLCAALLGISLSSLVASSAGAAACGAGGNPIACENTQTGDGGWEVGGGGSPTIEGFATAMSVNAGQTISFKIRTMSLTVDAQQVLQNYTIDIYRLGWYGGAGGRKLTPSPTPTLHMQPTCVTDPTTGLIDCGNWAVSATWTVPSTAVSGVYEAHIQRTDADKDNQIIFVVRNDSSHADVVYQTSDTTWEAYNDWGGNSLYTGAPASRAYMVSYNRPFSNRQGIIARDYLFSAEYPMIRFLEKNGYDVSYISGIDTDRAGSLLLNHKTFMSVGHDEYWSGQQRANVEAARNAGVNLAFFSGNEVFWKTRWQNSTDGSNTPYRTLVSYKETHANAPLDPLDTKTTGAVWTGTWRDPRFSPPADGGRPENALTGTIWTVNCCSYPMQVPAADGKMRFWRGTSVATQAAGATATLADETLGYEWDEDLDNGSRPAGLIDLSHTTQNVAAKVIDYGSNVAAGPATHSMTLYRASSGAIVFGAGTVQWSWGLDDYHDGNAVTTDVRMQQATVNILADMGAQPSTVQAGLSAATASTDTTPPQTTITAPAAGASLRSGSAITVTGTATDTGGQVGGVEVSLDGGSTWHPATGRASWSYTGSVPGKGAFTIEARATDDSLRTDPTPATVSAAGVCPCPVFADNAVPTSTSANDAGPLNLGMRFTADQSGYITGVRFYKGTDNTGTHVGALWTNTGQLIAQATFSGETASGWQTASFTPAPAVTAGTTYVVSYYAPNGHYASDSDYFSQKSADRAPMHAPATTAGNPNGIFEYGSFQFPTGSYQGGNYWVDAIFDTVAPPDTIPPHATPAAPLAGSSSVPRNVAVKVAFDEQVQQSTVSIKLTDPSGGQVQGTISYDSTAHAAVFQPNAALAAATTYTATVSGVADVAGNVMTAPVAWSFKTQLPAAQPGVCPCGLWDDTAVPATASVNDGQAVELGMKFKADGDGTITGVRFYKGAQNTGTHTGSLWSIGGGTPLATVTFTGESTSGWQTASFSTPVSVTAGTYYVVSYHTNAGFYSATSGGMESGVDSAPLHAPASGAQGGNDVYKYGASAFPTSGGGANYWVDAVYLPAPDTTPPTVQSKSPVSGSHSVPVAAPVKATFNEALIAGTVQITLNGGSGNVAGTLTYDAATRTATFDPTASLAAATTYTATVVTAKDAAGNSMAAPVSWTFVTSGLAACPCTIFSDGAAPGTAASTDSNSVELGVKFRSDSTGWISGVRFYKGAGNTGAHTGSLWSSSGVRLATGTFTGETASGWQQLTFANPVAVTAGTTYVASYHAPNGHYAADLGYFTSSAEDNPPLQALASGTDGPNGVYSYGASAFPNSSYQSTNYWVDAVFSAAKPADSTPPAVVATSPADGVTSVPATATASVTFDEDVVGSSVSISLTPAGGSAVAGTTSYNPATRTATFTPTAALESSTVYTGRVSGAADSSGNAMPSAVTWSFTTAAGATGSCPCTLFADADTPQVASANDPSALELGVRFSVDTDGYISGVRFYKGTGNTGVHFGHLWSNTGTLLASARFTGESTAGWQTVTFAHPVAVSAGTIYVASYFAPNGGYAVTRGTFEFNGVDRAPLHAPKSVAGAPNGVYQYGASAFPTSGTDTNYWVDAVYVASAGSADTAKPTVAATTPAAGATGVATTVTPVAEFSEPVAPGSLQFTLTGPGSTNVAGTLSYNQLTMTVTFTPSAALAGGTPYTATVTATDPAGNAMAAPKVWTFTTG